MKEERDRPAALYARVSTPAQEQEATIESQVAAIEAYAQGQGVRLAPQFYFLDEAVSGATLDRPALNRLRDLAADGLFELVLCLSPDRLARHYPRQWVLLDQLQRVGVQVRFVNQPPEAQGPAGDLFVGLQGLFAEYERTQITERLRRGKLHRLRQGQLLPSRAPYGYTYLPVSQAKGGRWEIHPQEAAVVEQMFRWYTEEGLTMTQLVARLNQSHAATPPRGQRWTFSTVQRLLAQPAYVGQTYYNRTQSRPESAGQPRKQGRGLRRTPAHTPRPVSEWIPVTVPAILSESLWQRTQERTAMNQQFAVRNNSQRFYLLRGLLVCGVCGHTLAGRGRAGGRNDAISYFCTHQGQRRAPDVVPHSVRIAGEVIEPLVWQAVATLLGNPRLLADAWQHEQENGAADAGEAERLQARLRSLERQWQRLLDAFQDALLDKEELIKRKQCLDQESTALHERLQLLTQRTRQAQAKEQLLDDFARFCQQIQDRLETPTPQLQQEVIRLLIDHIVVHEDALVIKHIIPTDDDCRLLPGHR